MKIPKFNTSKSKISKTWRKETKNILGTTIQISSYLQYNIIIKIVVHAFCMKVLFLTLI